MAISIWKAFQCILVLLMCSSFIRSENITKSRCGSILNFGSSGCHDKKNNNTSRGEEVESIPFPPKTNNTLRQRNSTENSFVMHRNSSLTSRDIYIIVSVTVIVIFAAGILVVVWIVRIGKKKRGTYDLASTNVTE